MRKILLTVVTACLVLFFSVEVLAGTSALKNKIDTKAHELATRFESQTKTERVLNNIVDKLYEIRPRVREQTRRVVDYYIEAIQRELDKLTSSSASDVSYAIPSVDMQKVKQTRLGRFNSERTKYGLIPYVYDSRLDTTAQDWAQTLATRYSANPFRFDFYTVHERVKGDGYYNYSKITEWFADRGVIAKNVNSVTHTENVGIGGGGQRTANCNSSDCTQQLINALSDTFDGLYISEKPYNGVHYRGLVKKEFRYIGFGLVASGPNSYVLVIHYITDFE